ncbi:hypothetical protein LJR034_005192 [Caballeronia sp. LjRoot34]
MRQHYLALVLVVSTKHSIPFFDLSTKHLLGKLDFEQLSNLTL